jgi:hypothetical protein
VAAQARPRNKDGTLTSRTTNSGTTGRKAHQKGERKKADLAGTNRGAVSQRQIAAVIGASQKTVSDDFREQNYTAEKNETPPIELTRERDPEPVRKRGRLKNKLVQSGPVSKPKGGRGKTGGLKAASRELGISHQDARRALKVASLTEEASR